MSEDTRNLTALQMLDQLNRAIEESGINETHTKREPLEIFRNLLQNWYVGKDLSWADKEDDEVFALLLKKYPLHQLQKELKKIYNETLELSTARKTLTIWTRRELDQHFQRVQQLLGQERQEKRSLG